MDVNGNHFLRKLFVTLPLRYLEKIIDKIFENFLCLANDKNSVCVLKAMVDCLGKQIES